MSDDPERELVNAVGFDVTQLSEEELRAAGVALTGKVVTAADGKAWMSHETFARRNPEEEERARRYARLAAYHHFERQYLKVRCPRCGRSEGRPCKLAVGPNGPRVGYPHAERRKAAERESAVSLHGLRLERAFPCAGTFREAERVGRVLMVQCDSCGFELGVAPPKDGDQGAQPVQDDIPL